MDEATLAALRDDIAAEISMAVCLDESNDEARDFLADRIEDERMGRHVAEQRGLSRAAKTVRSFASEVSRG